MASWGTLFDATWWVTTRMFHGAYWIVWGTPETAQAQTIRETKERLDRMETKIEQIWALQTEMVHIDVSDPHLMSSMVLVHENGTQQVFPSTHFKRALNKEEKDTDPFEEA